MTQSGALPTPPADSPAEAAADPLFDAALVEEAVRKSALLWVTPAGRSARPVWHVWHEGAVHVLQERAEDGVEQHVPGLADAATAEVTVRSKDKGGRLITWTADVTVLTPAEDAWPAAAAALHAERLNAPDGENQPDRWSRDCVVVRLAAPRAIAHGTALPDASQSAAPVPTSAKTRGPVPKNFSLGRRLRGR